MINSKILPLFVFAIMMFCSTMDKVYADNENKAKAYYFAAEESYENGNYGDALKGINKVKSLLGKNNAVSSALTVKIFLVSRNIKKQKKS